MLRLLKNSASGLLGRLGYSQVSVFYGWLRASGWLRSLRSAKPVDAAGQPLPWYSYPFIHFLGQKLPPPDSGLRVFEFGSGNSTLWWSRRASQLVAIEDHRAWHSYVAGTLPPQVCYLFADSQASYVGALAGQPGEFDIVIVDGSHREDCIAAAPSKLSSGGVIIVDNSDWTSLAPALQSLADVHGFRRLEFYGLGPMNGHPWGTSVFYREGNVLGC